MRRLAAVVMMLIVAHASPAGAQPEPEGPYEEIQPGPAPPPASVPPPAYAAGYPDARSQEKQRRRDLHRWLKENDPEYRGALSRRTSGIVVASVVGGVGLLVGVVAGMVWLVRDGLGWSCDEARGWTIGGFLTMGVGLGVGLPLAVTGHRRVKEIRQQAMMQQQSRLPRVQVSLRRRGGGVIGLSWEF